MGLPNQRKKERNYTHLALPEQSSNLVVGALGLADAGEAIMHPLRETQAFVP